MLNIAIDAAKQGGELALKYFKSPPKTRYKADKSPVTVADIEVEKLIRKLINKNFPDHGIIGEELPPANPKSKYQWVIDPIDGTRDFIRQIPYWAVFICVLNNNEPVVSVVYLPAIGKIMIAQKGKGTYINGNRKKVSKTKDLKSAYISFGSMKRFEAYNKFRIFSDTIPKVSAARSYGNLGLQFLLEGKIDAMIEAFGGMYDFAAPSLLTEEAGGKFTDFSGKFSLTSGNAILSNGILHSQVLKLLNEK